jgi:xylose isomerase
MMEANMDWKFTGRLQSFLVQPDAHAPGKMSLNTLDCIDRMSQVEGVKYVEPNYPMHFEECSPQAMAQHMTKRGMKASGVALRYPVGLCAGEFTNRDSAKATQAMDLTMEAAQVCRALGGKDLTIWSTYDGFDYPFQVDYAKSWHRLVAALREVAQANPDLQISIEYKPYEPRPFYFIDGIGTVLLALEDAKCDNLGVTLDVCHMLMKKESPAYCLALAADRGRLHGIHLNEGYGDHDDGLMIGAVNFLSTLEFIYYLRKYRYDGVVFFDTFPLREDPVAECRHNIQVVKAMDAFLERLGDERVASLIEQGDAVAVQKLFLLDRLLA